jgi:hypothetical protein
MGKLRVSLVLALAACGSSNNNTADAPPKDAPVDTKVFLDAPPDAPSMYDFSCLGQAFPTTAPAAVDASGTAETLNSSFMLTPVTGATVDACPSASLTCPANGPNKRLAATTTDMNGNWAFTALPTAMVPLDLYVKAIKTGELTTYLYPAHPLAATLAMAPMLMLSSTQLGLVSSVAGVTLTPGDSTVVVLVLDCANMPITSGATVTVQQGGTDVGMQFSSAQAMGSTIVFNVPPGATTIGASYNGMTFPTHPVNAFANGIVTTAIRPGP